ncbi:MAG TPA: nickel-dependent lactate racemase, partial [Desulfobulbaceae bacterium]|nr:nickel-dependent lactate racemase [Desulfobulbaceae bacterium]
MAKVTIPFDGKPLRFQVPDANLIEVLSPARSRPLIRLGKEIEKALDNPIGQKPLQDWVRPTDRVILISDDNTRLTPADRIIPPMLDRLNAAGVADEKISCIMALGTHRYMCREELIAKVGPGVLERIRVFNHEWRDPAALVDLGVSRHGTPLLINRAVVEADVVIGLGAIVPHHIPGFSGSSKIIQPGVSGAGTTAQTHILSCESGGDSFLGIHDNPVRSDMDDIADRVGMSTIFNVVLDSDGRVCGLFFGEMRASYRQGIELARRIYGVPYCETPDIVLANSHPCNLDFWQSHKSLYPAQRMIKKGGSIICCTPAPEGVSPVHTELLSFTSWSSAKIKEAYHAGELKNGVACALAI